MKNAMRIVLAVAVCALMVVSTHSQPTSAQTPPVCQQGTATYDPNACAAYSANPYCQVGNAAYNAALCASATSTGTNAYCAVGTASYNASLCAQFGNTTTSPNFYCQAATYNAQLCVQNTVTNPACQVGNVNYNAVVCQQQSNTVCQTGTTNYSAAACNQYTTSTASSLTVSANQVGVDCGGVATVRVQVNNASGVVSDGTPVTVTVDKGTISPPSGATLNGSFVASFKAPATPVGSAIGANGVSAVNNATIVATSGVASSSTQVTLNCTALPPTPVPTARPAPIAAAPIASAPPVGLPPVSTSSGIPNIQPPNTGDGGLLNAAN